MAKKKFKSFLSHDELSRIADTKNRPIVFKSLEVEKVTVNGEAFVPDEKIVVNPNDKITISFPSDIDN